MGEKLVLPITYTLYSAIVGTQQCVQAKCLAELVEALLLGANIFTHWFTYAVLVAWIFMAAFWVRRLNNALSMYDPQFFIPLMMSCFIVIAVLSGGIFFQEFVVFSVLQWIFFWGGIAVMLIGLVLLASAQLPSESDSQVDFIAVEMESSKSVVAPLESDLRLDSSGNGLQETTHSSWSRSSSRSDSKLSGTYGSTGPLALLQTLNEPSVGIPSAKEVLSSTSKGLTQLRLSSSLRAPSASRSSKGSDSGENTSRFHSKSSSISSSHTIHEAEGTKPLAQPSGKTTPSYRANAPD